MSNSMSNSMSNPIVTLQNNYLANIMVQMTSVLQECNSKKNDCICSVQVSYVNDIRLDESARFRTSIYCAEKNDPFHDVASKHLYEINKDVDPLNNK